MSDHKDDKHKDEKDDKHKDVKEDKHKDEKHKDEKKEKKDKGEKKDKEKKDKADKHKDEHTDDKHKDDKHKDEHKDDKHKDEKKDDKHKDEHKDDKHKDDKHKDEHKDDKHKEDKHKDDKHKEKKDKKEKKPKNAKIAKLFKEHIEQAHSSTVRPEKAEDVWNFLVDSNKRFANGDIADYLMHYAPTIDPQTRLSLVSHQKPFAVIVTCCDSRVSPEVIFGCGIGQLFVIRVAGNIFEEGVLGSVLYAVEHLGSQLVLILGHQNCGAVAAALKGPMSGAIGFIVAKVLPVVEDERKKGCPDDQLLSHCIAANVRQNAHAFMSNPEMKHLLDENKCVIKGAVYNLNSGLIEQIPLS